MVFSFCFIFAVLKWQKSLSCEIFYIWKALKRHNIPPLFLLGRASSPSRFRCLEDDILSILILLVFVFFGQNECTVKNRQRIFKPLLNVHWSPGNLPSMSVLLLMVLFCRHTQSGSFSYATVFPFCDASSSSALPWKLQSRIWCLTIDHFNTESFHFDPMLWPLSSAAMFGFLFRLQSNCERF